MSEEATPTEGAETAPAPSIDFGPIMERFSAMESRIDGLATPAAPVEPEAPADPYAPLDNYYEDDSERTAARQLLEQILNPAVEQATQPLLQQIAELQKAQQGIKADLELGELEARYPRLASDEEYTTGLLTEAQQLATQLGQPELASNATLIEKLHLARMGAERAAAETPAGGVPTGLEAASGATPGAAADDGASLAKSIVQAGGPTSAGRMFWGA